MAENEESEDNDEIVSYSVAFAALSGVMARFNFAIAIEPSFLKRYLVACLAVAISALITFSIGCIINFFQKKHRLIPKLTTIALGTLAICALSTYGSWPGGKIPSQDAVEMIRAKHAASQGL